MNTDEMKPLAQALKDFAAAIERLAELPQEEQLEIIERLAAMNEEDNTLTSAD